MVPVESCCASVEFMSTVPDGSVLVIGADVAR